MSFVVDRRDFLKATAAGMAALAVPSVLPAADAKDPYLGFKMGLQSYSLREFKKTEEALEPVFAGVAWIDRAEPLDLTHSDPQPDVSVIAGRFENYADHPTTALLVVEVADATLSYDLTTKAELYATAGIPDYWVLDVTGRELHVFRDPVADASLGITAYQSRQTFGPADSVSLLAAPTASVRVADLLP